MKQKKTLLILCLMIALLSGIATATGIFYKFGRSRFEYETIRGTVVEIYGKGLYKHMSADLAVQGIAQDVVTFFIAIPLLLAALRGYLKNSVKSMYLLTGVTGYFFATYLFYMTRGMNNELFLVYVTLLGLSFFALYNLIPALHLENFSSWLSPKAPVKFAGGFLIFNSVAIALMWLGRIVAPLLDGSVYQDELHHYSTLIVQGYDLGLLLPVAFISERQLMKRKLIGFIAGIPFLVFLSLLMIALTAKLIAMGFTGMEIFPAVVIFPAFNLTSIMCAFLMIKKINV